LFGGLGTTGCSIPAFHISDRVVRQGKKESEPKHQSEVPETKIAEKTGSPFVPSADPNDAYRPEVLEMPEILDVFAVKVGDSEQLAAFLPELKDSQSFSPEEKKQLLENLRAAAPALQDYMIVLSRSHISQESVASREFAVGEFVSQEFASQTVVRRNSEDFFGSSPETSQETSQFRTAIQQVGFQEPKDGDSLPLQAVDIPLEIERPDDARTKSVVFTGSKTNTISITPGRSSNSGSSIAVKPSSSPPPPPPSSADISSSEFSSPEMDDDDAASRNSVSPRISMKPLPFPRDIPDSRNPTESSNASNSINISDSRQNFSDVPVVSRESSLLAFRDRQQHPFHTQESRQASSPSSFPSSDSVSGTSFGADTSEASDFALPQESGTKAVSFVGKKQTDLASSPEVSGVSEDWELAAQKAAMALYGKLSRNDDNESLHDEINLRLLQLALGNRREATRPVTGLSPELQEFWRNELLGLATLLDQSTIPDSVQRSSLAHKHLLEARTKLQSVCPIKITNLCFINSCKGFGIYEAASNKFSSGNVVTIYAELENLICKTVSNNEFLTKVSSSYELLDQNGMLISKGDFSSNEKTTQRQVRDVFIFLQVEIPKELPPGRYFFNLTVSDLNSPNYSFDQQRLEFVVLEK